MTELYGKCFKILALMGSILSHSLMTDGKKEYYKQSVLQSKEVNLSGFLAKTLLAMTMNRVRDIVMKKLI